MLYMGLAVREETLIMGQVDYDKPRCLRCTPSIIIVAHISRYAGRSAAGVGMPF